MKNMSNNAKSARDMFKTVQKNLHAKEIVRSSLTIFYLNSAIYGIKYVVLRGR